MFLPTRNLRDHIGPTIEAAIHDVVGDLEVILWDTTICPIATPAGTSIQGFLALTTVAPTITDSITSMISIDVRTLADSKVALEAIRHLVDSIRSERARTLAGGNGGGLIS